MTNHEISAQLSLLSKLMDIHGENGFKAKSYANAAFQIDRMEAELSTMTKDAISSQRGIGAGIAGLIAEMITQGSMQELEQLIAKTPPGILELMKIKGIGPKKIATIWHELGIESPGELLYACHENRLIHYKGFGEKSQQSIVDALTFYFSNQQRYLFASIEPIANQLEQFFAHLFSSDAVFLTGAFKRQCDIIDELDIVIEAPIEDILQAMDAHPQFALSEEHADTLSYVYNDLMKLNLISCDVHSREQVLFLTRGSQSFVDEFDKRYPDIDYHHGETGDNNIFVQAGLQYVPVCLRDDVSVLDKAAAHAIPDLITSADIRGVIHTHSTWSDGLFSIQQMAEACISRGYEYLVVSDHSVTSFYANGLDAQRIMKQHEEIDALNQKLSPFKIYKSIECDILGDGRLDYDDAILSSFDLVIASVHQNLKMTQEKAMSRLLQAIANPHTRILGHPSGRLLLSRKAYPLDYPALIAACKQYDVVIEINANPRRLDIDWQWIQEAIRQGVMLSVNPDAHTIEGIDDIRYGVLSAQKGMLTADMNLSSLTREAFELFLARKQKRD